MANDGGVAYCLTNMYVYLDTHNIYFHSGFSDTMAGNRRGPKPRTPAPSKSAPLKPHGKKDGARRTWEVWVAAHVFVGAAEKEGL